MTSVQKMGEDLTDEHLTKETGVLKDRFPKLDTEYLLNTLIENKGHVGKEPKKFLRRVEMVQEWKNFTRNIRGLFKIDF